MTPPQRITSPDDPRLDPFRSVADPERIRARGLFVAEGRRVVRALLADERYALRGLLLTARAHEALRARAGEVGADVLLVEGPAALRDITGHRFHQGCIALAELPPEVAVADLDAVRQSGPGLIVVLEGITDPDNVGTIFRSACAFGAAGIVVGPRCAHPLYRKALRTSMGTALTLPFATASTWPSDLAFLRRGGFRLLATTPASTALPLGEAAARCQGGRCAILLGSEERGLSDGALAMADLQARIPHESAVDSLNVAAAAAIALHRLYERRGRDSMA